METSFVAPATHACCRLVNMLSPVTALDSWIKGIWIFPVTEGIVFMLKLPSKDREYNSEPVLYNIIEE